MKGLRAQLALALAVVPLFVVLGCTPGSSSSSSSSGSSSALENPSALNAVPLAGGGATDDPTSDPGNGTGSGDPVASPSSDPAVSAPEPATIWLVLCVAGPALVVRLRRSSRG